jgi:alkylation response protein AidB-like acyl-CoA dehydrogenase
MIIVPTGTPGFRVAHQNMGDMNTNQTFYDDVRVPGRTSWEDQRRLEADPSQLNHERVTLCSAGMIEGPFDDFLAWARETKLADGRRVIDQPWVQQNVARIYARLEFMRLMNFKIAWEAEQNLPMNPAYASAIKVFGTEFYMEACRLMLEVMGQAGTLRQDSPEAVLGGRIEFLLRGLHILTFGGGVNELQRDLIALFGLSMPVMPRF